MAGTTANSVSAVPAQCRPRQLRPCHAGAEEDGPGGDSSCRRAAARRFPRNSGTRGRGEGMLFLPTNGVVEGGLVMSATYSFVEG